MKRGEKEGDIMVGEGMENGKSLLRGCEGHVQRRCWLVGYLMLFY